MRERTAYIQPFTAPSKMASDKRDNPFLWAQTKKDAASGGQDYLIFAEKLPHPWTCNELKKNWDLCSVTPPAVLTGHPPCKSQM